ncbi:MAG: CRISPR system precrRNA processing endoribonuclease RAMP protein Cas6 [Anaerolineae bacterium]
MYTQYLTAHHLEFTLEALTPVSLNEHQGSALRGALYHGLRAFCAQRERTTCAGCLVLGVCPVAALVSTLDPEGVRGQDLPRPYVLEPPLDRRTRLAPGERLTFGLTLLGAALPLFPYVVQALRRLEEIGLGKGAAGGRRGRVRLVEAWAANPLSGERQPVLHAGETIVQMPDVPVTAEQVRAVAAHWPRARLALQFLTPTRLMAEGRLVRRPEFGILFHRLWQRVADLADCRSLSGGSAAERQPPDPYRLVGLARQVRLVRDGTHWVELESYSTRQGRATPIGGFVGRATYEGDLEPFLPWLVWGQVLHVGKDAVKGNGWYRLEAAPCT